MAASTTSTIKLKLLIDLKAKMVIYAEAGKDFVDFLLYLLTLPVATVFRLLKEKTMVGSFGHVYESIENLPDSYLQPNQNKNSLVNPRAPVYATEIPLMLADHDLENRILYRCDGIHANISIYAADVPNLCCPCCKLKMTREMKYVSPSPANTGVPVEGGFLKGLVTYIVTDNLEFMPMSTKNVVNLLNKFNVRDVGTLEEVVSDLGMEEGLKLLKLSLECKSVLSSFYMGNMKH